MKKRKKKKCTTGAVHFFGIVLIEIAAYLTWCSVIGAGDYDPCCTAACVDNLPVSDIQCHVIDGSAAVIEEQIAHLSL